MASSGPKRATAFGYSSAWVSPSALAPGATITSNQKRQSLASHHALLPRPPRRTRIPSFGSWLEPRYIFAAGQLV